MAADFHVINTRRSLYQESEGNCALRERSSFSITKASNKNHCKCQNSLAHKVTILCFVNPFCFANCISHKIHSLPRLFSYEYVLRINHNILDDVGEQIRVYQTEKLANLYLFL